MTRKRQLGLLPKLTIGIVSGALLGFILPEYLMRIVTTFVGLFSNYLNFVVPLIIVAFVVPGIANIGKGAGKILGFTVGLSYFSTDFWAFFTYFTSIFSFPKLIDFSKYSATAAFTDTIIKPLFEIDMPPLFNITSGIIFAFMIGIGISVIKNETLYDSFDGFQKIIN